MGNTHVKPHPRTKNKKQVHWKAADRPQPPGKPFLAADNELTPDLVTIRWTKPLRDGGSPITGYLVEHRRTGSPHWVRASPFLTQSLELSLSGLEPGWRYQFRVSAQNAVGLSEPSESSEPLTVTLQKYAITAPKFTEELQDTVVLENEKVEFVVHFLGQPTPKICWFKDGFEIFSSRRTRILTENDKSVLTIHQSALSDEGEIKCTATNKAGHASTKARLTLEAPPSIRLPRQYEDGLLFEIGEVIRLKVSVVGRPTPLVFWTHNGESIQNNDRYEVEYIDKCSILKITDARRSDRGEYQIKAVNKIGEDIASFLVTITDKPSPPGKARVVMTLGRSVTLSWSTPEDDGGCKIGNYIVEYYRLGWNVWLKAATSRQLTTILGDLIEGSEYKFRVKAESPYGVSEPSEESEVVFIPDPKRGITTPQIRSKSQPKDIIDEITGTPVATARRKHKGQPRSHSTTKAEITYQPVFEEVEPPKRPERSKIKSPPKTPEISPQTIRKPVNLVTETIMDRASIARELAYGSPEIKVRKSELDFPKNHISSSNSERSYTNSPVQKETQNLQLPENKTHSDDEQKNKLTIDETQKAQPANPKGKGHLSRENSDNLGGSSEFMLVLYPDSNEKGQRSRSSDLRLSFEEDAIPPPMSLSAPELRVEPPLFENLRQASSSTELLHERAMMRFNEAAANEEVELEKRRLNHLEIPKIQINSKDNQAIVGLERRNSGRRLSTGTVAQKRTLWAQRRYSLRNSKGSSDLSENSLQNSLYKDGVKAETSITRQRSVSQEMEEKEFEKVRNKMTLQKQSNIDKHSIEVVDEDKWLEDYEESVTEEETDSSEDERLHETEPRRRVYSDEEDEEIYHPGTMTTTTTKKPISDEPFEILTKRNKLPDPNFVPKPILKRSDEKTLDVIPKPKIDRNPAPKVRSNSPMPKFGQNTGPERQRSSSLVEPILELSSTNNFQGRRRSSSLIPQTEEEKSEQDLSNILPSTINIATPGKNVSSVAQLTGLTAASIVISESILKTKDNEEAKVVIDHYGDIVRTYSEKRKKNIPNNSKNPTESGVWQTKKEDEVQKPAVPDSKPSTSQESLKIDDWGRNYGIQPPPSRKNSLTTESKEVTVEEIKRPSPVQDNTSPVGSLNIQDTVRKERSPSPIRRRRSPTPQRGRSNQKYQRKSSKRSKTPSKSPTRLENWSDRRKSSPSPMKRNVATITTRQRSKSPSPIPLAKRRPMLKEIMTQTSVGLEMRSSYSTDSKSLSRTERTRQEELLAKAEIKVRGVVDYMTDLAMFMVACWLYLFSNELLAIPVLIIMVYRQLADQVRKRIPKWIMKRFSKKNKK